MRVTARTAATRLIAPRTPGPANRFRDSEVAQLGRLILGHDAGAGGAIPSCFKGCPARRMTQRFGAFRAARTPVGQQAQRAGQPEAIGRELVGEAERTLRVGAADDEAVAFEAPEAVRQDVGGEPGHLALELVEATRPSEQGLDDQERPAVADA